MDLGLYNEIGNGPLRKIEKGRVPFKGTLGIAG